MAFFSDVSEKLRLPGGVRSAFRRSYAALTSVFDRSDPRQRVEKCVLGVVKYLLSVDGEVSERKIMQLRNLLVDFYPAGAVELLNQLRELPIVEPKEALEVLMPLSLEAKRMVISFLLQATLADETASAKSDCVATLATEIGMKEEDFAELNEKVHAEFRNHTRLLRSGAGILVALGVIIVFILMATWLRSVAFGLIGAYLLLPLEKFYERRLREKKGIGYWIFRGGDLLLFPLRKLSALVSRHTDYSTDEYTIAAKREKKIIAKAVAMTTVTFLLIVFLFATFLFSTAGMYTSKLRHQEKETAEIKVELVAPAPAETQSAAEQPSWWQRRVTQVKGWFGGKTESGKEELSPVAANEEVSEIQQFFTPVINFLDRISEKFQKNPWVQRWIAQVQKLLKDEEFVNHLWAELLRKSGGIFSFSVRLVGTIAGWVVDLLLSIFFGLLFLIKLAEFCRDDESKGRQSEYLVRTVFNGAWLPDADESTIADANRIISGTIARLRIWARGYITIVLIDMIVYTLAFFCFRVPYFPILGLIAGCGVLLPYIGPISTAILTVLVTVISGGGGAQILGIIIFYLIYSGVIEQFITYPAIIGESLGLSTLETIIVVLLGALFAGITGMILALPAASVIKFLIPQIYRRIGDLGASGGAKNK